MAQGGLPFLLIVGLMGVGHAYQNATLIHTSVIPAQVGQLYHGSVNASHQILYQFDDLDVLPSTGNAHRVYSLSRDARTHSPLSVVVRQTQDIISWELPLQIRNHFYQSANRTLCPGNDASGRRIVISVSTASPEEVSFDIMLYLQPHFQLRMNQPLALSVSPSAPLFYEFNWPINLDYALLKFESNDSICTVLSVQNRSCPVYDMDRNVKFEGSYQTVNRLTGLTFTKERFPNGLFVVLVIRNDDSACYKYKALDATSPELLRAPETRLKYLTMEVSSQLTSSEYLVATLGAIGLFLCMYVLVFIVSCVLYVRGARPANGVPIPEPESPRNHVVDASGDAGPSDEDAIVSAAEMEPSEEVQVVPDDDSSLDETDIDMLADAEWEKEIFRTKQFPFVSDLARKSHRVMSRKLTLYHWNLWTIAIFYSLPVVQLMVTYQKVTNSTGDQDLCYYNFLCAHPLGVLSDFNHVYSNLGYVMLGLLFMAITWYKDLNSKRNLVFASGNVQLLNEPQFGIPQHFGMYYAMGLALVMEGIMSACYHVCPNHTNFQFDTAFMYTISILILLKIYQTRHPDITANAYTAFGALAFVIFVGVIGVLNGSVAFWVLFTALHVVSCLSLSFQVYYMGRFKIDRGLFKRIWLICYNDLKAVFGGHWQGLKPIYPDRMILLLVMNAVNWGMSAYGVTKIAKEGGDFASFLLAIFITNVMLYTSFYIVMKLRHRERVRLQPTIYIILSIFSWAGAMYFFINKSTTWQLSPAQSRSYNKECAMFHFYDNHDIWHFLSATSLFLSFMILLTLDDDLKETPREKIPVF